MSNGFQLISSYHYQWAHLEPTGVAISPLGWNPTDPARFISPDAYPNNKNIWRGQGIADTNSLSSGPGLVNNPIWGRFAYRLAGTWLAPRGFLVSANWTAVAGSYTGPIIDPAPEQRPANPRLRTEQRDLLDRRQSVEPARDADPFPLPDSRRGSGS